MRPKIISQKPFSFQLFSLKGHFPMGIQTSEYPRPEMLFSLAGTDSFFPPLKFSLLDYDLLKVFYFYSYFNSCYFSETYVIGLN